MDQLFVMGLLAAESVVLMKSGLKSSGSVNAKRWDVGCQDSGSCRLVFFRTDHCKASGGVLSNLAKRPLSIDFS